jgi:hypothetical protein
VQEDFEIGMVVSSLYSVCILKRGWLCLYVDVRLICAEDLEVWLWW